MELREQLIGYVLDALTSEDRLALEARLREDPILRVELAKVRELIQPLDHDPEHFEPPPQLAARTCRWVWFRRQCLALSQAGAQQWQAKDTLVAAGICVAAALLLMPAIQTSQTNAGVVHCGRNLFRVGAALTRYSEFHDNFFPQIPQSGNGAGAGIYAPTLVDGGYLDDPQVLVCPASALARQGEFRVPSMREIQQARGETLLGLRQTMGGSYGYSLGHCREGEYQAHPNHRRTGFAVVADAPNPSQPRLQSDNHGGVGQNVLFEGGNVRFWRTPESEVEADSIFTNHRGNIAAGISKDDAVIGRSDARPLPND